jgi:hypothetical protein
MNTTGGSFITKLEKKEKKNRKKDFVVQRGWWEQQWRHRHLLACKNKSGGPQ